MSYSCQFEEREPANALAYLPSPSHCVVHPSLDRARKRLTPLIGRAARLRNDRQKNGICGIQCPVACFRVAADRLLVEKGFRILFEDTSMVLFKIGSHATHDGHCKALRPTMFHKAQPVQEGKGLVLQEPDLDSASLSIRAKKSVVPTCWVVAPWHSPKRPIGFKKAL